ncbi:MAG: LuxR C-terminal-related transcriptional regulator [Actinomycetota bacterium]
MTDDAALEEGREAYRQHRWRDAFSRLRAARNSKELEPDDLALLATAAFLIGEDDECVEAFGRAHHAYLELGMPDRAARCAFRAGFQFMNRGDMAQAGGWFGRGQRVLDEAGIDCVERGYLLFPVGTMTMFGGDPAAAQPIFQQIGEYGERFRDPDLKAMSRLGEGECLIMLGRVAEGTALHDEAMLAVTSGEVFPMITGLIYCAVIETCRELFDWRRSREWTDALTRWCASQPDLVPYRGQCLVHRAEIMQLHGEWPGALDEAERAREVLSRPPPQPAVGEAFYELAEIHRLRGDFAKAESGYRSANESGKSPQPGVALLRLAQGQVDAAFATITRVVSETAERRQRCRMLAALVDIALAAGNVASARHAADELTELAAVLGAPYIDAIAQQATGAVLLAEDDPRGALAALRSAATVWHSLEAPYEAALGRVLIGSACRKLGDSDSAAIDLDAARRTFERLGAGPALARIDELEGRTGRKEAGGLSAREIEVLRLVAAGKTNRGIASDLVLSEKTVARHLSNIFTKLGVPTRAAATAYAYEHDLV